MSICSRYLGYLQILGYFDFNNLKTRSPLARKFIMHAPPTYKPPPPILTSQLFYAFKNFSKLLLRLVLQRFVLLLLFKILFPISYFIFYISFLIPIIYFLFPIYSFLLFLRSYFLFSIPFLLFPYSIFFLLFPFFNLLFPFSALLCSPIL